MKKYILAIDQGTTSSRVVLYDDKFKIKNIEQKEFKQYFPKDGWVEHDAEEIWDDVKKLIHQTLKKNYLANLLSKIGLGQLLMSLETILALSNTNFGKSRFFLWFGLLVLALITLDSFLSGAQL